MTGFLGVQLRQEVYFDSSKVVTGATVNTVVNRYGTFERMFTGCAATWGYGPTRVPQRGFAGDCPDAALAYAQHCGQALEPYPNKCVRPQMAFQPTELKFAGTLLTRSLVIRVDEGEHVGREFIRCVGRNGTVHWVMEDKTTSSELASYRNKARKEIGLDRIRSNGTLRCICCGQDDIDEHGFLLCFRCNLRDAINSASAERLLDFKSNPRNTAEKVSSAPAKRKKRSVERKDNGYQDDRQSRRIRHYPLLSEGHTNNARPLDETELAWILAAKFKGFTIKNSKPYLKARIAAAQLASHYLLGRSFSQIAEMTGKTTKAVNKFCTRSREEYFTKLVRGPIPEELQTAKASGMFLELYPREVTEGCLMRSKYVWDEALEPLTGSAEIQSTL